VSADPRQLPPDAKIMLRPGHVASIELAWERLGLSDAMLHDEHVQNSLREALRQEAGEGWKAVEATVRDRLDTAPHAAVVIAQDRATSPAVLAALAVSLGNLADPYRQSWSRVIQEVRPRAGAEDSALWHVDSPGWRVTNALTCLLCVKPTPGEGATEILPWASLARGLAKDPALAGELRSRNVPWVLDEALGGGVIPEPIVSPARLRYMRTALVKSAAGHPQDAPWIEAVNLRLERVLELANPYFSHRLDVGEILIFDNWRSLHRRGPIRRPVGSGRLLLRARIDRPSWRRDLPALCGPWPETRADT
jgi:Taurine catabolism dioxygenase TauD, TfdA family